MERLQLSGGPAVTHLKRAGGPLIFTSGFAGTDRQGRLDPRWGIVEQTTHALNDIEGVLLAGGGSLADVKRFHLFCTTVEDLRGALAVMATRLAPAPLPPTVASLIDGFALDGLLVEIDAIAEGPASAPPGRHAIETDQAFNPKVLAELRGSGNWAQGYVVSPATDIVVVSGITAPDAGDGLMDQTTACMNQLRDTLAGFGAGLGDVVKFLVYLADVSQIGEMSRGRSPFYPEGDFPASTAVQLTRLARPGARVEFAAIAVLPPRAG